MCMKILHDWDDPYLNWKWAALIGFKYLIYAFFSLFGVRPRFTKDVKNELRNYAETLVKIDILCNVSPIFGIRDVVKKEYPEIHDILSSYDNVEVRKHVHIIENYKDPNRKRIWDPPLKQSKNTWHYDKQYVNNKKVLLNKDEIPVWHVDRSYFLKEYIDFLYNVKIKNEKIYKKGDVVFNT